MNSFVMPVKCNFSTCSVTIKGFFSVLVEVDILEWYLRLKMLTYALENSCSTIAGNLCYANVAMWECYCHCHCIYHCFFHSYCHYQLILLFLLLHQLLLIQLFTLIASLISTYIYWCWCHYCNIILPNNLLLRLLLLSIHLFRANTSLSVIILV